MALASSQRKYLRGLSHDLRPVVTVADKGLSENVMAEIERALDDHELIKVKLRGDRDTRSGWIDRIVAVTGAERVHDIGQVACLYRRHPEKPRIALP